MARAVRISKEVRDCSGRSSGHERHLGHTVTTASNEKFSLTGSFVVTRRHAEQLGSVYIDWNRLKTRVRERPGELRAA
jgi:hypothetical protein